MRRLNFWVLRNCKFAQAQFTYDDKSVKQAMDQHLNSMRTYMEEEIELSQTPLDKNSYLNRLELSLGQIPDPSKSNYRNMFQNFVSQIDTADPNVLAEQIQDQVSLMTSSGPPSIARDLDWSKKRYFYRLLIDLEDHLTARSKQHEPVEAQLESWRQNMMEEYQKGMAQVEDLKAKLQSFSASMNRNDISFSVTPNLAFNDLTKAPVFYPLNFSIEIISSTQDRMHENPNFSMFVNDDGSIIIEDVLEWGDTDFFADDAERSFYFGIIDYMRTGKLPQEREKKFITLYRGMSAEEHNAWQSGKTIEKGKFFTSSPTSQFAQDISGQFPELFRFRVRNDSVTETGPGTFQIMVDSKMEGNKITPS
jgi:hypothetical protein